MDQIADLASADDPSGDDSEDVLVDKLNDILDLAVLPGTIDDSDEDEDSDDSGDEGDSGE